MAESVLTARDLNRALLARQMLLAREAVSPLEATRRLVALQGQFPRAPFVGLWARLQAFAPADLLALIQTRAIVRATWLRGTLHLVAAEDFLAHRALLRAEEAWRLPNGVHTTVTQLEPVLAKARAHFAEAPRDFESLRELIGGETVEEVRNLAYAARILLPLVQASVDTPYGFKTGGEFVMARTWLGKDVAPKPDMLDLVRRYLAAYGPATPGDFTAWSGIKGAAALFEALGDEVVRFRDDRKRVLFDLKDAPRPDPDTLAPPRLLPDFDGAVLGHQDRSRIIASEHAVKAATTKNLLVPPIVLLDGFVAGTWKLDVKRKTATVTITPFAPLSAKDRKALEAEALDLARVFEPASAGAVEFAAA